MPAHKLITDCRRLFAAVNLTDDLPGNTVVRALGVRTRGSPRPDRAAACLPAAPVPRPPDCARTPTPSGAPTQPPTSFMPRQLCPTNGAMSDLAEFFLFKTVGRLFAELALPNSPVTATIAQVRRPGRGGEQAKWRRRAPRRTAQPAPLAHPPQTSLGEP